MNQTEAMGGSEESYKISAQCQDFASGMQVNTFIIADRLYTCMKSSVNLH